MTSAPARLTKPTSSASINSTTHATRIRRLVVAMMRYLVRDDIHPTAESSARKVAESAAYKSHAENKLMHTRPTLKATMSVHETELSLTCKKSPVTKRAIVQRYKRPTIMRECRAVQGASGQCRTSRSSRNIRTVQVPFVPNTSRHRAHSGPLTVSVQTVTVPGCTVL